MSQRATLSPSLTELRPVLRELVPILNSLPESYGSVYLERKASKSFLANLKQTQLSDSDSMGVVLRIYNGYTLFEQATDHLSPESLLESARKFVQRVGESPTDPSLKKRPYPAVPWSERLKTRLESEISSQIPENPGPGTPVHFGVKFERDPRMPEAAQVLENLKSIVASCKKLAPKAGLSESDLTYAMARQGFSIEESIFLDSETDLSQTLYRLALRVITMSGSERTSIGVGGLGGLEAIEVQESRLLGLLKDLASLRTAERLEPGKYRVLCGPVVTGVLAHEAFGHSQEGDTCARGRSKAWELHKTGERVGNEHATILNNPAIYCNGSEDGSPGAEAACAAWGSYFFDEEGWLAQEQVLLERGKLKAPMTSLTSAIRLGVPRTANGKRESWSHGVYTRQTNTYFSAGQSSLDELMRDLGHGFVALHPAGGMEDPKGMGIQVGISFLQEVKNGKLTGRIFKGPAGGDIQMTGYTPDILNSILGKSKIEYRSKDPDQARHPFNDTGGCGKYHKEFVYAGCGGPYVLLDQVILG